MLNQLSSVGFGTDATVLAGYACATNSYLGNVDFIVENVGSNTLWMEFKEYTGAGINSAGNATTAGSGYVSLGSALTIVPGGQQTQSLSVLSQKIGFFGSGSTTANISCVFRNPSDLRGAQIDMNIVGRRGWSIDSGYPYKQYSPVWGSPPDSPTTPAVVQ